MAREGEAAAADGAGRQQLTTDGVRVLRRETSLSDPAGRDDGSGVLLQVLGVFRYLVDPALKQQLGQLASDTLERDVFDVLLSDGRNKMKCVLSPEMNHVVWCGDLSRFDVMRVTDFDVFQVKDDDDNSDTTRPVCFIKGFEIVKRQNDAFLVTSETALIEKDYGDDLEFVFATVSERETNMTIPVAGKRMYYMALNPDNYALLDWTETTATKGLTRQYCSSLGTSEAPVIHNMIEIKDLISSSSSSSSGNNKKGHTYPSMTGIVRVKSKVTHFGEPGIANPLPFVFHIVLVDSTFAFEIAFFGSSCAKYFGAIQEGDLIQLRGYSASVTEPEDDDEDEASAPKQLLYFEHESDGEVFHIPANALSFDVFCVEDFWKYLEMAKIIPEPVSESPASSSLAPPAPIRLECNFASTLDTLYWSEETCYFDFVGVLSYVGKVCRRRKRKRVDLEERGNGERGGEGEDLSSGPVGEYRWVKAVDRSSSTELVILVQDCSQPQEFYSLKAGNTVMLTKLKWIIVDDQEKHFGVDDHIFGSQYAACSSFTVLRVNDAVSVFNAIEDCSLNSFFAEKLVAKEKVREKSSTGESWLEGGTIKKYRTRSSIIQPADLVSSSPSLEQPVYQFSELSKVCKGLEKLEHQHITVIGRLISIPKQQADTAEAVSTSTAAYEIEFGDNHDSTLSRKAALRVNSLFKVLDQQPTAGAAETTRNSLKGIIPKSAKLLLKTLSPAIVDELFAAEMTDGFTLTDTSSISKSSENKKKRKRKHKKKNQAPKGESSTDGTRPVDDANNGGESANTTAAAAKVVVDASIQHVVVDAPTTTAPTATVSPSSKLTPEFLELQLTKSNRVFLFSTHLYRTQDGEIDVEVDAILPYALKV